MAVSVNAIIEEVMNSDLEVSDFSDIIGEGMYE